MAYATENLLREWNVMVTARNEGFERTCMLLGRFSPIKSTDYTNALVMKVDDFGSFFDWLMEEVGRDPGILKYDISRIVPAQHTFAFDDGDDLGKQVVEIALGWLDEIAGHSFHVRMHRRGLKGRVDSREIEERVGRAVMGALQQRGETCLVEFEAPDLVIDIETLGHRAGLSLWTREAMQNYLFLRVG